METLEVDKNNLNILIKNNKLDYLTSLSKNENTGAR